MFSFNSESVAYSSISPYCANNFINSSLQPNAGTFLTVRYLQKTKIKRSAPTKISTPQFFIKQFHAMFGETRNQLRRHQSNTILVKLRAKRNLDSSQTVQTRQAGASSLFRPIADPASVQFRQTQQNRVKRERKGWRQRRKMKMVATTPENEGDGGGRRLERVGA